uniref:mitogen-activated protein kinase kinase n=1 Tax=Eutreptiella gymnastica TaxID=73025 RepID=A0A7S1IWY4_9EUGL|mmetsp:Transcript_4864/g.8857  ORF Transcript_4864/g.8857 Transcript_4864/m.8857 type:complete len:552 (+) Transcript_4864:64-1719(+)
MKRGLKLALDPSFAEKEEGAVEGSEDDTSSEEEDDDESEDEEEKLGQIAEFAKALLREYMHKHNFKETLRAFDAECPRSEATIESRQVLKENLYMKSVVQRNKSKGDPWSAFAMMEHMIEDRIFVASGQVHQGKRAQVVLPQTMATSVMTPVSSDLNSSSDCFNASFSTEKKVVKKKKKARDQGVGYELDQSGSKILLAGQIELSSQRVRSMKEIAPADSKISDLTRGKLINDVAELDLKGEIPLGAGASGRVSRVLHVPSTQYVAVKKISIHDENLRKEISKELQLLYCNAGGFGSKAIIDPDLLQGIRYIIRFYGAFFHEGNALIALECMVGSLEDALTICGTIPEEVLRAITWQTVSALYYLHKGHHIQHRDIKSANLLLSKDGRVKVSDFGVASDEKMQTMAPAQTFVGTVIYMSPERLKGHGYSPTADLWSLGLVLIHAATGVHPFRGMDMFKILDMKDSPKLPDKGFSKDFADFVTECLMQDPLSRPTSEEIRRHKWISNMTEGRSERLIMEWASPIIAQLEMQRANDGRPAHDLGYDILDNAIV